MYRWSSLIAAVLASATVLSGQQTSQAPVFRSGTALVRVDVTVLDAAGKPVPGLTPDDFEITLDGRVQKVQTVDYQTTPTKRAVSATNERQGTNATPVSAARLVVVLVDDLSMAATRNRDLFHAASRFVAGLPDSDLVGFTTTSGTATVNPTRDHAAVVVGLRRGVGQLTDLRSLPPDVVVGLNEAVEIEAGNQGMFASVVGRDCLEGRTPTARDLESLCAHDVARKARLIASVTQRTTDMQMATYQAVINAMRPVAGEKALVILSDGLIMPGRGQRQVDIKAIEREAATAGVHVSVLYGEPELINMSVRAADEAQVRRADGQALGQGIENIAGATGGDFYRLVGQPDRFFGFVADAMSAVYHLGVEMPPTSAPGREFKLSARVRRAGVTVRANRVALQDVVTAPEPVDAQLQAVVTKGELKYGVPVAVGTVIRPGSTADDVALGVNVEVPAGVPGPLTVLFAAVDDKGNSRTGKHTLSAQPNGANYRLSFSVPMPSGSYRLRVGIADADGQVGGLDVPVVAQLTRVGPFRVSDILTAWIGPDKRPQFLSLGKIPFAASSLLMGIEVVPDIGGAPPSDVRVTWTILTESAQKVAEQTVPAAFAQNRLNAQTQVSVASLPAGTYELRATILVANQTAGVTSMTFRKGDKEVPCFMLSTHAKVLGLLLAVSDRDLHAR
jgi:VWFA-related protein